MTVFLLEFECRMDKTSVKTVTVFLLEFEGRMDKYQ